MMIKTLQKGNWEEYGSSVESTSHHHIMVGTALASPYISITLFFLPLLILYRSLLWSSLSLTLYYPLSLYNYLSISSPLSPYLWSQPSDIKSPNVLTVQQHTSFQRIVEAEQQVYDSALPAPRWTYQRHYLSGLNYKRVILANLHPRAGGVTEEYILQLNSSIGTGGWFQSSLWQPINRRILARIDGLEDSPSCKESFLLVACPTWKKNIIEMLLGNRNQTYTATATL